MTKVSIIVPVYNAENSIRRCVDSVLAQSSKEWELLLINDGSKDSSEKIIFELQDAHPDRIRAFTQKNSGVTKTRERGIKEAVGEFVMFLDNDDYLDHDYVETLLSAAEKEKADLVICGYRRITETGKILFDAAPVTEWMQYSIMTPWARIIRKSALIENDVHFLDYKIGEDLYLNMKLYAVSKKTVRLDYIGYNWFYNTQSVNNTTHKGMQKVYDPLFLLDQLFEVSNQNRDAVHQAWFTKWVAWYLLFSGRDASKKDFMAEEKRLFHWLDSHGIKRSFPMFSKITAGEPFKNKFAINVILVLKKLHMLGLFASIYCKG